MSDPVDVLQADVLDSLIGVYPLAVSTAGEIARINPSAIGGGVTKVVSRSTSTPPSAPSLQDAYIVPLDGVTGWGYPKDALLVWDGSTWLVTTPSIGSPVWVVDEQVQVLYDGGWIVPSADLPPVASTEEVHEGTEASPRLLSPKLLSDNFARFGALQYLGPWNASTNFPPLSNGGGGATNVGGFYIVSTAGSTTLDGESDWPQSALVVSRGDAWVKGGAGATLPQQMTAAEIAVGDETQVRTTSPAQLASLARVYGGTASGTAFPPTSAPGMQFDRTDLSMRFRRAPAGTDVPWEVIEAYAATSAPTASHDVDYGGDWGFIGGSRWIDTTAGKVYECQSAADGAADWRPVVGDVRWDDLAGDLQDRIDAAAAGITQHAGVRVVATANLDLTGAETIDGVDNLLNGDRILAAGQTAQSEGGVYVYNDSGAWNRSTDCDAWDEFVNAYVLVAEGATYGGSGWRCAAAAGGVLGTDPILWRQFTAAAAVASGTGVTVVGRTVSLAATGVPAGSYVAPVVEFNAQGQATQARSLITQVLSRTTADPPSGASVGDAYIMPTGTLSGAWAAKSAGTLTVCTTTTPARVWVDMAAVPGFPIWVVDEEEYILPDAGGGWTDLASKTLPPVVTAAEIANASETAPRSLSPSDVAQFALAHSPFLLHGAQPDAQDNFVTLSDINATTPRLFKIAATVANPYFVWVNGKRITITSDLTVQIPAPPTGGSQLSYVYITAAGALAVSTLSPWDDASQGCPVAGVYWRDGATAGTTVYMFWSYDRLGNISDLHRNLFGTVWRGGFDVPTWGNDGAFSMSAGSWTAYGFTHATTAAVNKTTVFFRSTSGWTSSAERTNEYRPINAANNALCFDDAGIRKNVDAGNYTNVWLFASCRALTGAGNPLNGSMIVLEAIMGQAQYTTREAAEAESIADVSRPDWHKIDAARPLYRVTLQRTTATPKGEYVSALDLRSEWIVQGKLRGAQASPVSAGVTSYAGRSGAVVPAAGDITYSMIGEDDLSRRMEREAIRQKLVGGAGIMQAPYVSTYQTTFNMCRDFGSLTNGNCVGDGDPDGGGTLDTVAARAILEYLRSLRPDGGYDLEIDDNRIILTDKCLPFGTLRNVHVKSGAGGGIVNKYPGTNTDFRWRGSVINGGTCTAQTFYANNCYRLASASDLPKGTQKLTVAEADRTACSIGDWIYILSSRIFKQGTEAHYHPARLWATRIIDIYESSNELILEHPTPFAIPAGVHPADVSGGVTTWPWKNASNQSIQGVAFALFKEMTPNNCAPYTFTGKEEIGWNINFYNVFLKSLGGPVHIGFPMSSEWVGCEFSGNNAIYGNFAVWNTFRDCIGRFYRLACEFSVMSYATAVRECRFMSEADGSGSDVAWLFAVKEMGLGCEFLKNVLWAPKWNPLNSKTVALFHVDATRCLVDGMTANVAQLGYAASGHVDGEGNSDPYNIGFKVVRCDDYAGARSDEEYAGSYNTFRNIDATTTAVHTGGGDPGLEAPISFGGKRNTFQGIRAQFGAGSTSPKTMTIPDGGHWLEDIDISQGFTGNTRAFNIPSTTRATLIRCEGTVTNNSSTSTVLDNGAGKAELGRWK